MRKTFVLVTLFCMLICLVVGTLLVMGSANVNPRKEFYHTKGDLVNIRTEEREIIKSLCCDFLEKETGKEIEDSFIRVLAMRPPFLGSIQSEFFMYIHVLYQNGTVHVYTFQVEGVDDERVFNTLRLRAGDEGFFERLPEGFFINKSVELKDNTIIIK